MRLAGLLFTHIMVAIVVHAATVFWLANRAQPTLDCFHNCTKIEKKNFEDEMTWEN